MLVAMPPQSQSEVICLERSKVEAMIRGLTSMTAILAGALELDDPLLAEAESQVKEEEEAEEEDAYGKKSKGKSKGKPRSRSRSRNRSKPAPGLARTNAATVTVGGSARGPLPPGKAKRKAGKSKGGDGDKGGPPARRGQMKTLAPCHYQKRYEGEGCELWAVTKVSMRGTSSSPKERFCCRTCGEWLASEGEDGAEPLADWHGDL